MIYDNIAQRNRKKTPQFNCSARNSKFHLRETDGQIHDKRAELAYAFRYLGSMNISSYRARFI